MGLFGKRKEKERTHRNTGHLATLDSGEVVRVTAVVDCIGDSCPRPQLLTRGALGKASPGEVIEVNVDNPTSMEALPPIIRENEGTHLGTLRHSRHWQVLMRKNRLGSDRGRTAI